MPAGPKALTRTPAGEPANRSYNSTGKSELSPAALATAATLAEHYLTARRARLEVFPRQLFGEPDWDILLQLFVHHVRSTAATVTDACNASGVPPTSALRHISRLEEMGLVTRRDDPGDRRRRYLGLDQKSVPTIARWVLDWLRPSDGAMAIAEPHIRQAAPPMRPARERRCEVGTCQ